MLRSNQHLPILSLAIFLGATIFLVLGEARDIVPENTSQYLGNGRWSWTIYLKGSEEALRDIKCVEYTLHPTFPNPVRTVCDRGSSDHPFALSSSGWGVFEISIKISIKDDGIRELRHMLAFETPSVASRTLALRSKDTATQVRPGWWNWTVYIEGSPEDLLQVRCVEYKLHPTFPDPIKEVCQRGSGPHAFPLSASGWGTFPIQIRIILKNGQIQKLTHDLTF